MYIVVCLPAVSINEETETPETDLTKKSPFLYTNLRLLLFFLIVLILVIIY